MFKKIAVTTRNIGVNFKDNHAQIQLWAPHADKVRIIVEKSSTHIDLQPQEFGYWELETDLLKPGNLYKFELTKNNESKYLPDPASTSQPSGVHKASAAFDLKAFSFSDRDWKGIPLKDYIIYELHIGTFTPEGDLLAATQKLDHLIDLGVNAIELMPLGAFPGERNWGYDGVFPFAVQQSYGGPAALQQFVEVCHSKGINVILDVVYNHLGPEGNYFEEFAPYFTDKYKTPWGKAINFDDAYADGVRHYYIENVLMWFRDFHIDALRMDAVHAIKDFSASHILAEIRGHVDLLNVLTGRNHFLIAECDLNDPKYINPQSTGGYGMHAQWMDEFHHTLRVAAGQERTGYYADFNGVEHLAKSYEKAYIYDGIYSEERKKTFGAEAVHNPGEQFVVFSQNHDQVGNRMLGERSGELYSLEMQKLLIGAVLVSPFIPLLFMGEEWGETNPFLYFVSHSEKELINAVREGRAAEFKAFHQSGDAPDPQSEESFLRSKLQWDLLAKPQHKQMFAFYKEMIALRTQEPSLTNLDRTKLKVEALASQQVLILHRWEGEEKLLCFLNFSEAVEEILFSDHKHWHRLIDSAAPTFGGSIESSFKNSNDEILKLQPQSILIFKSNND